MRDQASIGLDRGDMSVNKKLMFQARWIKNDDSADWVTWVYEQWLSDGTYRKAFLNRFNLHLDSKIRPSSEFGGGSSFSNNDLGKSENNPLKRWEQTQLPDRVISLIHDEGLDLLQEDEREYLLKEYNKRTLPEIHS